jgi:hypothetical protein
MGGYWDAALTKGLAPRKSKWPARRRKAWRVGSRLVRDARRRHDRKKAS